MVIIDTFSRFLCAYPGTDNTGIAAAEALLWHAGYFGFPDTILSDGGAEYRNQLIDQYCALTGSHHQVTLAHSHQENSIVERANKEINRWLRDLLYDQRRGASEWSSALPFAIRLHNNTVVESTGYTPSEIVFGDSVVTDRRTDGQTDALKGYQLSNLPVERIMVVLSLYISDAVGIW